MIGSLIVAALLLVTARESAAFRLLRVDGNPCGGAKNVSWPDARVPVDTTHLQPAQFATYAISARDRWNDAVGAFRFQAGRGTFCDPNDGITAMGFADVACDGGAFGDAVALTVFRYTSSGDFIDADVSFPSSEPVLNDRALFTQITMHELGHVLGLAHSDACGASGASTLMRAVTFLNEPRLDRPQDDDIAGARAIYAPAPPPGDGSVPEGTNSCAIAPLDSAVPAAELLITPAVWLIWRRQQGKRK